MIDSEVRHAVEYAIALLGLPPVTFVEIGIGSLHVRYSVPISAEDRHALACKLRELLPATTAIEVSSPGPG